MQATTHERPFSLGMDEKIAHLSQERPDCEATYYDERADVLHVCRRPEGHEATTFTGHAPSFGLPQHCDSTGFTWRAASTRAGDLS